MIYLNTSIERISGIGPILQKRLKNLGIKTVNDFLYYFPARYEDFSNLIPVSEIKINEVCTIQGKILDIKNIKTWKRKMFLTNAIIEDKTGAIKAVWFNQPFLTKTFKTGDTAFFSGKVVSGKNGIYLSNPIYEKYYNDSDILIHTGRLVPVYPETKGIYSRWIRAMVKFLLTQLKGRIPEAVPEKIIKENNFLPIEEALWQIHFPESLEKAKMSKIKFSFEEIFFIQLFVLRERAKLAQEKAIETPINIDLIKRFVDFLPFKLTDAQKKCAWQILKDLEKPRPMNRLLEGDVGSGKTVVAAIAALNMAKAKHQVAFMAPTEILAKQHFNEVAKLVVNFNLNIGLLTGKSDKFYSKKLKNSAIEISRKKLLEKSLNCEIDILIGTHALIQDKVKFGNLGLVVLDEQHRFGVKQRAKLCKGAYNKTGQKTIPHLLSMTATPIPRTLALTIYGDLDLSIIDQLPKGRKKIITKVISHLERKKAYDFIKKEVKKGRQAFVICPRIEANNNSQQFGPELTAEGFPIPNFQSNSKLQAQNYKQNINEIFNPWSEAKAVKEEYKKLSEQIFPDLKVGMLHGKMAGKEKERIMKDFSTYGRSPEGRKNKIDILVSTSVIEVGVDIPNATVMMIEGADRFGLAQLHQFRGRVGRSKYQSYCFLFTDSPSKNTRSRLRALIDCENGFALAEKDLEIRGPGDFIGVKQWGLPDMMMNSLKDLGLVQKTKEAAKETLISDPQLKKYPLLQARLRSFREKIHLE